MNLPTSIKQMLARSRFLGRIIRSFYYPKRVIRRHRLQKYRTCASLPPVESKVLVAMNGGIGNAVYATPLVQAIRMLWRRAHITILPPSGDLFDEWSVIDRIVARAESLEGETFAHTFVTWKAGLPEWTTRCHLGDVYRASGMYSNWLLRLEPEQVMRMIRRLGYHGSPPPLYVSMKKPVISIPASAQRFCLAPCGKPSHLWRNKRWPHYRTLAESLLTKYPDSHICVIGGPEDEVPGGFPDASRIIDLRGRLTLRETAWVLKHCDLAIGNDSGPMHIADAVMTTSLALFGPTCPLKNGPVYRGVPLSIDLPCTPCQYDPAVRDACDNPRCMTELTAELVLQKATCLLTNPR